MIHESIKQKLLSIGLTASMIRESSAFEIAHETEKPFSWLLCSCIVTIKTALEKKKMNPRKGEKEKYHTPPEQTHNTDNTLNAHRTAST